MAQTSIVYQPGPHQLQHQYQQQFPALRPVVPQPGTDPTQQYGGPMAPCACSDYGDFGALHKFGPICHLWPVHHAGCWPEL
jgi:hypothetical protein